jgi:hypothetical protein
MLAMHSCAYEAHHQLDVVGFDCASQVRGNLNWSAKPINSRRTVTPEVADGLEVWLGGSSTPSRGQRGATDDYGVRLRNHGDPRNALDESEAAVLVFLALLCVRGSKDLPVPLRLSLT